MDLLRWMHKCLCLILLLILLTGCGRVSVSGDPSCRVIYQYGDISFSETLTAEEASAVARILNGKVITRYWFSTPSCGFDRNIALEVNGVRYAIACDQCATLMVCGTINSYIELTREERDVLEAIFTARGGKFPCV